MTVARWCVVCAERHPRGVRCPRRPPRRGSDSRAREAQRRFREQALAAAGHQCQHVGPDGIRCGQTFELYAGHVIPYRDDANFERAVLLCAKHHLAMDHAR